ncbi:MAG: hypothetical protein R3C18_00590 [Planctomycetaceae bacterium]
MRNAFATLFAALALTGAIGMFLWGPAVVGVLEILTIKTGQTEVPASLVDVQWAAVSVAVFCVGALLSFALRLSSGRLSTKHKWLGIGIGVAFGLGGLCLLKGVLNGMQGFQVIAASTVAPKASEIGPFVSMTQQTLALGYGLVVASCLATMLLSVLEGQKSEPRRTSVVWTGSAVICGLLLPFTLLFTWLMSHAGHELQRLIMNEQLVKPVELARQLNSILMCPFVFFAAVVALGCMHAFAYLIEPIPADQPVLQFDAETT